MAGHPILRTAALLLGLATLGAIPSQGMVAQASATVATVHSGARASFTCRDASSGEGIEGFPPFLHSLTNEGLPIDSASQHMSSGFAGDVDWLRLIPTSVPFMSFSFPGSARISAAFAIGALVTACGGGGAEADAGTSGTSASTSSTSSTTDSSTGSQDSVTATAPTQPVTTATGSTSTTDGAGDTTTDTATDSTTVVAVAQTGTGAASTGGTSAAAPSAKRSSVALNLAPVNYYSQELPTIDVMKRAGAWLTQCSSTCGTMTGGASGWDTLEEAALDLDANGWIKSLPASSDTTHKYRTVATALSANGALPLGRYIVRYDGSGTITYSGFTKSSSSTAGRDVIDLTTTGNAWMTITATNPSNYIRNIRIYLPGGACANDYTVYADSAAACNATTGAFVPFESFPAGQIWHPQFLQDIKGFRALRFMDWNLTNSTSVTSWAGRTPPGARTWSGASGVPIEAMLDLANMVGADAWLNVPPYADDNYAAQIGALAATHLTNGVSKVDMEYGNETWNYAFPASNWILAQAKAKWPQSIAAGVSAYTLQSSWYGERLAQVCRAAKSNSTAVRCVLNGMAANSWSVNQSLSCPYASAELGHACAKDIDVVSIAPYFGYYISAAKLRSVVATWYADPDGGLSKLFSEITGTDANGVSITAPLAAAGSGAPAGALAAAKAWMTANKAVADSYGLPLWAYEGGQHLVLPSGDTDKTLQALLVAANRDARMGAAYDRMIADWKSVGGQTFTYFNHVGKPGVSGMWGLKETMSDSANAKWASALRMRNDKSCNWSGC